MDTAEDREAQTDRNASSGCELWERKRGRIRDGAGIKWRRRQNDSMKLCTIRLSVCLDVTQHSEPGSSGCESPPVCILKPLQAGRGGGGVRLQLWPGSRDFNRLTLLTTFSKTLKHAWKCLSALCQSRSEKCNLFFTLWCIKWNLAPNCKMCSNGQGILFTSICLHLRQAIIIHYFFTVNTGLIRAAREKNLCYFCETSGTQIFLWLHFLSVANRQV